MPGCLGIRWLRKDCFSSLADLFSSEILGRKSLAYSELFDPSGDDVLVRPLWHDDQRHMGGKSLHDLAVAPGKRLHTQAKERGLISHHRPQ